jgi:hypothetical protein
MLIDDARAMLAAWREGLATDAQVAAWASEALDATAVADLPAWLLDLCMYGVVACMNRPSTEFFEVPDLNFSDSLTIRARRLDLSATDELDEFVRWVSQACIGEDLNAPEVSFGYEVDELWIECNGFDEPREYVRRELPGMIRKLPALRPCLERLMRPGEE